MRCGAKMLEDLVPPKNKAIYCKINQILSELDDKDKAILNGALANVEAWSANSLSAELRKRGISVADTTITKHRTKTCACYRD